MNGRIERTRAARIDLSRPEAWAAWETEVQSMIEYGRGVLDLDLAQEPDPEFRAFLADMKIHYVGMLAWAEQVKAARGRDTLKAELPRLNAMIDQLNAETDRLVETYNALFEDDGPC